MSNAIGVAQMLREGLMKSAEVQHMDFGTKKLKGEERHQMSRSIMPVSS